MNEQRLMPIVTVVAACCNSVLVRVRRSDKNPGFILYSQSAANSLVVVYAPYCRRIESCCRISIGMGWVLGPAWAFGSDGVVL